MSSYGEGENYSSPLPELDNTRCAVREGTGPAATGRERSARDGTVRPCAHLARREDRHHHPGSAKTGQLSRRPSRRAHQAADRRRRAGLLAPAIADAGLRIFGLEANFPEPRALAAEALAATVEETVNAVAELPPHVLENETLLSDAVHEAFESAAASYFPNSMIKPELRESAERHGMWTRMPARSERKRYAKYSDAIPVEISPRVADTVDTFGGGHAARSLAGSLRRARRAPLQSKRLRVPGASGNSRQHDRPRRRFSGLTIASADAAGRGRAARSERRSWSASYARSLSLQPAETSRRPDAFIASSRPVAVTIMHVCLIRNWSSICRVGRFACGSI